MGDNMFSPDKEMKPANALPSEIVKAYYESRTNTSPQYICHAPFNNMYFNSLGHIANCWLTFHDPEIYSEERTLKEIWNGEKFTKLREHIKAFDLDYKCSTCKHNLQNRNFVNVLSRAYDNQFPLTEYPSLMEFELSNTCNLECTMCTGLLSSSIRRNREHLPALKSPYGEKFVQELQEFIPHLHEARFNGGEPFLIKTYWQIWDNILQLNPKLRVVVATNGTVLNERVKDYLTRGNFHLNISIDGMSHETYDNIRVNSDIDRVLEHFKWFRDFCHQHNRTLCVMVNPMRQNWHEMARFVNFCNENAVHIWYNTIERPLDQAIWNLSSQKLEEIYTTLKNEPIAPRNDKTPDWLYRYNTGTFNNLVNNQIYNWMLEARQREANETANPAVTNTAYLSRVSEYMEQAGYTEPDKNNVLEKLRLLRQSMADNKSLESFVELMNSSPPAAIADALKSHPFEEAQKMLAGYLSGRN
ncbi:MAG TPA: radical SAM protein [Chitinophagales bacterium]|nr:radical SAM protein [Chitinophagales bacterium]